MTDDPGRPAVRRRGRLLLVGALPAALALALWLCVSLVPAGSIGVMAGAERVLEPGWHWHGPGASLRVYPAGPRPVTARARLVTPEGAAVSVPFELTLDLRSAGPGGLAAFVAAASAGDGSLDQVIARAVEESLGRATAPREAGAAARRPDDPQVIEALSRDLGSLGMVAGSLRIGSSRPAAAGSRPHPLAGVYPGPRWPILLIGIDGADWDVMGPMMERGQLPRLAALRDRGSWGTLRSMRPTLSPILWTTMATGRPPDQHGILDFLVRDAAGQDVPISRLSRRVKALWNIASDLGVSTATVGWWATWPAEKVTGAMVTDRVAYSLFDLPVSSADQGAVYPADLAPEVARLQAPADDVEFEEVRTIVPVTRDRFESARGALDTPEGYRNPLSHLIEVIASTKTYHRIARHLLQTQHPAVTLVYFEGVDEVNHRFAHYRPPAMALVRDTDPADRQAFAQAVEGFYAFQDSLVGELIDAAGPEAVTLIVSDHGFANEDERPQDVPPDIEGRPGLWHTMDGVFLAAGPPIRAGRLPAHVELLDVLPTVLAVMGLPQGKDMPGRVVDGIFAPGARPALPPVSIASYDAVGEELAAASTGEGSPMDREMMARLEALGYIGKGSAGSAGPTAGEGPVAEPAASGGAGTANATYHVNAGHVFLQNHELDRAEAEFRRARELAPGFEPPRLGLAQVALMRGRPGEALPLIEETLKSGEPRPALFIRAAQVYVKARRQEQGIAFLRSLPPDARRDAARQCAIGLLQESTAQPALAVSSFREALSIDPGYERALQGAYRLMRRPGELDSLASLLQNGLNAPRGATRRRVTNWLALTREAQGRRDEARALLAQVLEEEPGDLMTLINLGSMLVRDDRATEGLPYLERARASHPGSHEVLVNLIVAQGKLGRLDQARALFEEAQRAARPGDPATQRHNALAYAAFLNGDLKLAREQVDVSLGLDPAQPEARRLKQEIDRVMKGAGGL